MRIPRPRAKPSGPPSGAESPSAISGSSSHSPASRSGSGGRGRDRRAVEAGEGFGVGVGDRRDAARCRVPLHRHHLHPAPLQRGGEAARHALHAGVEGLGDGEADPVEDAPHRLRRTGGGGARKIGRDRAEGRRAGADAEALAQGRGTRQLAQRRGQRCVARRGVGEQGEVGGGEGPRASRI